MAEIFLRLLAVEYKSVDVKITGYIGKPTINRETVILRLFY